MPRPTAIALDGTSIYWVEHDGGTVMRADRGTGLNPKLLFPASEGAWPFDLAVAGGAVYFVDDHAVDVRRVPAGGGAATIVASGESASQGIAVAGSTVFFSATGQGDGVLWSAPLDGSAKATAFAELQEDPVGVAVDGANVYWVACGDTHSATGLVLSCPLTGCGAPGPRVLAKGQSYPWKVVVDERAVYWVNRGLPSGPLGSRERGAVLRLAK